MRTDRTEQVRGSSFSFGGPLLILVFFGLAGLGGLGFFLVSTGSLNAFAPRLFAAGGALQMPTEPEPRPPAAGSATGSEPALAEMPTLAETGASGGTETSASGTAATNSSGTADTWSDLGPDIGPTALLEQAASIPDRALGDTAFDLPPWRRYARPFVVSPGQSLIGVLVTGNGLDRAVTAAAIAGLPAEVSLSFSPYAPDLADWIAAARAFGHEALIDLPLQGKDFPAHDPGPLGLLIGLNIHETARRLDAMADAGNRTIGFAGADGGALLLNDDATAAMLAEIQRLGRAFVETGAEPMSHAAADATAAGVPFMRATVQLDDGASQDGFAARLGVAATLARQRKAVLAVARATPLSITAIAAWTRGQGQPARLAPVSALLNH
jgi:polysaccharide deacetylase 2 family uncharacterized protein YibQ